MDNVFVLKLSKIGNLKRFIRLLLLPDKYILKKLIFLFHDFLLSLIYGESANFKIFQISRKLNTKLLIWHQQQPISLKPKNKKIDCLLLSKRLYEEKKSDEQKRREKYNIDFTSMPKNLQKELHAEIRLNISKAIKSPFTFINTRSWKTLPNSNNNFGSMAFHRDGFWPGHLKVMIYLRPLDEDYGYFEIENNIIKNNNAGTAILFHNSDHRHKGVSGRKKERLSIEVTILRTFINSEQSHNGHFRGRHYESIFKPYFDKYKLRFPNT